MNTYPLIPSAKPASSARKSFLRPLRQVLSCLAALCVLSVLSVLPARGQATALDKTVLYVNEKITTFVVSGEPIKLMDISTCIQEVVGNQPGDNIVRLKAMKAMDDGQRLGVVTVVGERNISQFELVYVVDETRATTKYNIHLYDQDSYIHPAVEMSTNDMYRYCWRIMDSGKKFYDVSNSANKLSIRLNNLYAVDGYFFFDISVDNRSNIRFDIEEIRIRLSDKKKAKATNMQDIELKPVLQLNHDKRFRRGYRNIFVLEKLTFPDEKVLIFSMSETPISGRTIDLKVDYADVLNADSFNDALLD